MKRTLLHSLPLILGVGLWTPESMLAQPAEQGNEAKPERQVDDAHAEKADAADRPAGVRPFDRSKPVPWASSEDPIKRLRELQQAMKDELGLSNEQLESTDRLFEDHIGRLQEETASGRAEGSESVDIEELKSLRDQMMEARKAGDIETAKKLREQMLERAQKRRIHPPGESTSRFIRTVAEQLEKEQLEAFQRLVKRFGFAERERPRPSRLHALFRVVRDPELGLSSEQQRTIHGIVRDTLMAQRPRGGTRPDMDKVADAVRMNIAEHLTPEQNARFDSLLGAAEAAGGKIGPIRPSAQEKPPSDSETKQKTGPGEKKP